MGFNGYIKKYLAYHYGDPRIPVLVDKLAMKEAVKEYCDVKTPRTLPLEYDTDNFVLKATNDSGSTVVVRHGEVVAGKIERLNAYKHRPYGKEKGEWFYEPIKHQIIKEEFLCDNPTDYKFHMHNGKMVFMEMMSDRFSGKKSCTVTPTRQYYKYSLEETYMEHVQLPLPPKDKWDEMVAYAEALSAPWKYVRVDFYLVDDEIYLGELTFAPRAGNYRCKREQKEVGKLFRKYGND